MLTYSSPINDEFAVLPLEKIVSMKLAKYFWNSPFKSDELKDIRIFAERKWEVRLVRHREKTVTISNTFVQNNRLPLLFKCILKERIFSLYKAYRQMVLWKITYDPSNEIDMLKEGELYAPNYFTFDGEFNDSTWVRRFVLQSDNSLKISRFYLACYYWLENETATLWPQIKISNFYGFPFYGGNIDGILRNVNYLSAIRILQLEDKLEVVTAPFIDDRMLWLVGLKEAAKSKFEHAIYSFWEKAIEDHKINFIEDDSYFELMSGDTDYPSDKINYFLYSHLSKERKNSFLDWTIKHDKPQKWLALLVSEYTEVVRSEILEFICKLPLNMYSELLQLLVHRISQLKMPFDIKIFQVLWNKLLLEQKYQVLEENTSLIKTLIKSKSFYNVRHIVKGLPLEQKEKLLFNGWYEAGIKSLDILSKQGEFDFLQEYLSFFLFEVDPLSRKETLRPDARCFLEKFVQSPDFITWCKDGVRKTKVMDRISNLQATLALLEEICDLVSKEISLPLYLADNSSILREEEESVSLLSQKRKSDEKSSFAKFQKSYLF